MIKRQDIRIDNILMNYSGNPMIVEGIGKSLIHFTNGNSTDEYSCLGVKIHSGILFGIGAKKDSQDGTYIIEKGELIFVFNESCELIEIHSGSSVLNDGLPELTFLHQLQNLIYDLTGETVELIGAVVF